MKYNFSELESVMREEEIVASEGDLRSLGALRGARTPRASVGPAANDPRFLRFPETVVGSGISGAGAHLKKQSDWRWSVICRLIMSGTDGIRGPRLWLEHYDPLLHN